MLFVVDKALMILLINGLGEVNYQLMLKKSNVDKLFSRHGQAGVLVALMIIILSRSWKNGMDLTITLPRRVIQ